MRLHGRDYDHQQLTRMAGDLAAGGIRSVVLVDRAMDIGAEQAAPAVYTELQSG